MLNTKNLGELKSLQAFLSSPSFHPPCSCSCTDLPQDSDAAMCPSHLSPLCGMEHFLVSVFHQHAKTNMGITKLYLFLAIYVYLHPKTPFCVSHLGYLPLNTQVKGTVLHTTETGNITHGTKQGSKNSLNSSKAYFEFGLIPTFHLETQNLETHPCFRRNNVIVIGAYLE